MSDTLEVFAEVLERDPYPEGVICVIFRLRRELRIPGPRSLPFGDRSRGVQRGRGAALAPVVEGLLQGRRIEMISRYPGTCVKTGRAYGAGTEIVKGDKGWEIAPGASAAPVSSEPAPRRPFVRTTCVACGAKASRYVRIYASGECRDCYEERKMGY